MFLYITSFSFYFNWYTIRIFRLIFINNAIYYIRQNHDFCTVFRAEFFHVNLPDSRCKTRKKSL